MLTNRWRRSALFALTLLAFLSVALTLVHGNPVRAQNDAGGGIKGTLEYRSDDAAQTDKLPIEGGEVIVYTAELSPDGRTLVTLGEEVARGTSAADGTFFIAVPTPGDYVVELNIESLPEGVELVDADRAQLVKRLRADQQGPVLFNLAEGDSANSARSRTGDPFVDRFLRLLVDGIKFGLIIGMCAIGLSLIFGTTGLVNFAHSEMITIGAVMTWYLNSWGLQLLIATPIAMLIGGLFGAGLDVALWRPLRRRGTGLVAMMIVSIGLAIALRYMVLYFFGERRRRYFDYGVQKAAPGPTSADDVLFTVGPVGVLEKDFVMIVLSALLLVAVAMLLKYTKLGKAMRAVSDSPDLASSTGIDVNRTITLVWFMAGVLVTLGAVFQGLSEQMQWLTGNQLLLLVFAAVTLGGLGTTYGVMLGSLVIGILVSITSVFGRVDDPWVPSDMKNVGALVAMILLLMVRPQGLLGRRERIG